MSGAEKTIPFGEIAAQLHPDLRGIFENVMAAPVQQRFPAAATKAAIEALSLCCPIHVVGTEHEVVAGWRTFQFMSNHLNEDDEITVLYHEDMSKREIVRRFLAETFFLPEAMSWSRGDLKFARLTEQSLRKITAVAGEDLIKELGLSKSRERAAWLSVDERTLKNVKVQ